MFSWYKLGSKVLRSNFHELDLPYKLTYVVTKECHSRCVNCKIWMEKPENELNIEEIKKFASKNPFFSWVDFTGGEPTDRPEFSEIVQIFHHYNKDLLLTHFPTNGLKPEHIEKTVRQIRAAVKNEIIITVSIDGPEEVNDRLRGVKGDFQLATETFNRLNLVKGVKVYVGMTLYPQNISLIEQTIRNLQEKCPGFKRKQFHINIPHLSSHFYRNEDLKNKNSINEEGLASPEFKSLLSQTVENYRNSNSISFSPFSIVERIYQRKVQEYLNTGVSPVDCAALMASCYLGEKGDVFPCLIWNSKLGNIRETDYELLPIIKSDKASRHRALIRDKKCPQCWTPCEAYQSLGANLKYPKTIFK